MTTRGESSQSALKRQFEEDWTSFERDTLRRVRGSTQANRALSFGCGPGFDLQGLLRDGLAREGAGCDQSEDQLELARETFRGEAPTPLLFRWDGHAPAPRNVGQFDLVYVRLVFQHFDGANQILAVLRNLFACLEPGGYVVVHDVDRTRPQETIVIDLDDRVRAIDDAVASFQRGLGRYPDAGARLDTWLSDAGFTVTDHVDTLDLPLAAEENRVVVDLLRYVAEDAGLSAVRCVAGTHHAGRPVTEVFSELCKVLEERLAGEPAGVHLRTKKSRHVVAARR